jgi:hypothetical protein
MNGVQINEVTTNKHQLVYEESWYTHMLNISQKAWQRLNLKIHN